MTDKRDAVLPNYRLWIIGVLAGVLLVFTALAGVVLYLFGEVTSDRLAELGDSFGWITSLFTALAFAFVILALAIQMQEMRLTWQEIEASRKAQEKMAEQAFNSSVVSIIDNLVALDSQREIDYDHAREDGNYLAMALSQSLNRLALHGMLRRLVPPGSDAPRELRTLAVIHHGEGLTELFSVLLVLESICRDCRKIMFAEAGPDEIRLYESLKSSSQIVLDAFSPKENSDSRDRRGAPDDDLRHYYSLPPRLKQSLEVMATGPEASELRSPEILRGITMRVSPLLTDSTNFILNVLGFYTKAPEREPPTVF